MVADTHSFSAQPRAVNQKYRPDDPQEEAYYANIHFDKRVHRGSNYSKQQVSGQQQSMSSGPSRTRPVRRPRNNKNIEQSKDPFAIEIPKPERLPIDLLSHLVEKPSLVTKHSGGYQTDKFLDRQATPPFVTKKTGVDAATHINEGDLFHFDNEVEPLLGVLCSKTLEQSIMEVDEEIELEAFDKYKKMYKEKKIIDKQEEDEIVELEMIRHKESQRIKKEKKDLNYDDVRKKLMCISASRRFLKDIFKNSLKGLGEQNGLLKNVKSTKEVCCEFVPSLYDDILEKLNKDETMNERIMKELIRNIEVEKKVMKEKSRKKQMEEREKARLEAIRLKKEEEERIELERKRKEEEDGGGNGDGDGGDEE